MENLSKESLLAIKEIVEVVVDDRITIATDILPTTELDRKRNNSRIRAAKSHLACRPGCALCLFPFYRKSAIIQQ